MTLKAAGDHLHTGTYLQHALLERATISADAAGAEMKLFRKKLSKQDEKVLVEARALAAQRLEQYIADHRNSPPTMKDAPKKPVLQRLRLWW